MSFFRWKYFEDAETGRKEQLQKRKEIRERKKVEKMKDFSKVLKSFFSKWLKIVSFAVRLLTMNY